MDDRKSTESAGKGAFKNLNILTGGVIHIIKAAAPLNANPGVGYQIDDQGAKLLTVWEHKAGEGDGEWIKHTLRVSEDISLEEGIPHEELVKMLEDGYLKRLMTRVEYSLNDGAMKLLSLEEIGSTCEKLIDILRLHGKRIAAQAHSAS